ncbi:MAG TPA: hypothetical protein VGV86_10635 [Acidimicrobiales bacterium]|nr:hypothetical protein [Acidimicrobiales bacterium]
MVVPIVILVVWVAFGGVTAATMHRRGHDPFAWALFLALGPLALPDAMRAERRHPPHEQPGEAGDVLQQYAAPHGYEVIVMGSRSATSAHVSHHRAARTSVPVLIGPATR